MSIKDGRCLRPVHLWPVKSGQLRHVRRAFSKGRPFIDKRDRKITIHDLAPRTRIVLHVNKVQRIAFSLPSP